MDDDDNNNINNYNNPLYYHHHHHHQENPSLSPSSYFLLLLDDPPTATSTPDSIVHQGQNRDNIRLPQWTEAETKLLLSIRFELDRSFAETKRNKPLWEAVSRRMHHQGYARTPEQCKSKWKNLITRYKASEAMEGGERQFPFHEEMRRIFADRMERLLSSDKAGKEEENESKCKKVIKRKKKGLLGEVEAAIREFGRRQMEMESRWMEAMEVREAERRWKEEEWRREMAALAEQRMEMERKWREEEKERWAREDARDGKREAMITAILANISRQE